MTQRRQSERVDVLGGDREAAIEQSARLAGEHHLVAELLRQVDDGLAQKHQIVVAVGCRLRKRSRIAVTWDDDLWLQRRQF